MHDFPPMANTENINFVVSKINRHDFFINFKSRNVKHGEKKNINN